MSDQPAKRYLATVYQGSQLLEFHIPVNIEAIEFDQLNEEIALLITKSPGKKWILDLSRSEYFGSALLGMLVNIRTKVRSLKGVLILCHLTPDLQRVIRASSMERLFTIVETREEA